MDTDTLTIKRLEAKPILDGTADPSIRASAAHGTIQYLLGKPDTARVRTEFWCAYTDEGLYLAFECWEPRMETLVKSGPGPSELGLWDGDCVEVFLLPPGESATRHLLLTVDNRRGDYWDDGAPDADVMWDPDWESAVRLGKDRWSAEMFIPWRTLGPAGRGEGDWKANFARSRPTFDEFISWRPVDRGYCEPHHFGALRGLAPKLSAPAATPPILPGPLFRKAGMLLATACDKVRAADMPGLAKRDPFRAAAWMGLLSSMEWLTRTMDMHRRLEMPVPPDGLASDPHRQRDERWLELQRRLSLRASQLERAIGELQARLAVLDGREPDVGGPLAELLRVTTDPEAQVVVEFERPRPRTMTDRKRGSVSIDWGSLPLMIAQVEEFPTPDAALQSIGKHETPRTQKVLLGGGEGRFTTLPFWRPAELKSYDPGKEFILMLTSRKIGIAPRAALGENDVDALAFFPTCPKDIEKELTAWAATAGKKVISVSQIDPARRTAFFGTLDNGTVGTAFRQRPVYRFAVSRETGVLRFASGRLAFSLPCLSLESGTYFAEAILQGRALSPEQADRIRHAVVRAMSRPARPLRLPKGMDLYVGDLHDHTFYSDGSPSPGGLIAEAFYTHLDFCSISDHHPARNGAAPLKPLMAAMRFNYPLIPSVELTEKWGHFNIYPIREDTEQFSARSLAGLADVLEYAKRQGNPVVQWNHPDDWRYTTRDDLAFDARSGIDAWETYPPCYAEWKKAGTLPVLTGGTDTHTGVFGSSYRTIILAESPTGDSVARAIRRRGAALIDPYDGACYEIFWELRRIPRMNDGTDRYAYGDDRMIQLTVDALADGTYLKDLKRENIRKALAGANIEKWLSLFGNRVSE